MSIVILSEVETLAKPMPRAVEGPHARWRSTGLARNFYRAPMQCSWPTRVLFREPGAHASRVFGERVGDLAPEPPSPPGRTHVERTPPSAALCLSRKRPQPKPAIPRSSVEE